MTNANLTSPMPRLDGAIRWRAKYRRSRAKDPAMARPSDVPETLDADANAKSGYMATAAVATNRLGTRSCSKSMTAINPISIAHTKYAGNARFLPIRAPVVVTTTATKRVRETSENTTGRSSLTGSLGDITCLGVRTSLDWNEPGASVRMRYGSSILAAEGKKRRDRAKQGK